MEVGRPLAKPRGEAAGGIRTGVSAAGCLVDEERPKVIHGLPEGRLGCEEREQRDDDRTSVNVGHRHGAEE